MVHLPASLPWPRGPRDPARLRPAGCGCPWLLSPIGENVGSWSHADAAHGSAGVYLLYLFGQSKFPRVYGDGRGFETGRETISDDPLELSLGGAWDRRGRRTQGA